MLQAMAGFDPKDATSVDKAVPDYTATLNDSLEGLRIGLPKEYFIERDDRLCIATGNNTVTFRLYKIHETNATHAKIEWIKYIGYIAGTEDSTEAAVKLMELVND